MNSILRGLVNRRPPPRRRPSPTPPPVYNPTFVVLKPCGEIPQRHRFDGWDVILDMTEEGWIAHRHRNELWMYGPPRDMEVFDVL